MLTASRGTLTIFILSIIAFGTLYYLINYTNVLFRDIDPSLTAPNHEAATTTQPHATQTHDRLR